MHCLGFAGGAVCAEGLGVILTGAITRNFWWREFLRSTTAAKRGLDNKPDATAAGRIRLHCESVYQPVRDAVGRTVTVTSGYRSQALCRAIGSSPRSRHATGDAVDVECFAISTAAFAWRIWEAARRDGLPVCKLILECFDEAAGGNSGWVHIGCFRAGEDLSAAAQLYSYSRWGGYRVLAPERLEALAARF